MHRGQPNLDDRELWDAGVVRIYDILFDYEVLLETDAFFRRVMAEPEFQREMGTSEFHHLAGKYVAEREKALGGRKTSVLAAAHRSGVPVFTSSPGDSSIGMNVAEMELRGFGLRINPSRDVNETAAIVWAAKSKGGRSAVLILGGGSPKNFVLQTEPQIKEVLGLDEAGHDHAVLGDGEGVFADRLAVPAGHARQAVGDVLDLDVEGGGVEQVQPAAGQHPLPGAGFVLLPWALGQVVRPAVVGQVR